MMWSYTSTEAARPAYWLYAVTLFLSSFLLFQVQPLISKHILPWLGGGSAVWIAAMLFFMVVLSAGYFYALGLSRFPGIWQWRIHLLLIAVAVALLAAHSAHWPSAITPHNTQVSIDLETPIRTVFMILGWSVGVPLFLLSSTSTLFQWWYSRLSGREPFSLYAVSNAGSFLGLLSYPFIIEPLLATTDQGYWWTVGFALYVVLLIVIVHRSIGYQAHQAFSADHGTVSLAQVVRWVGITSVPVITMLFGTSHLTTSVATIPFLWIAPLTLYLLSFVISFRTHTPSAHHLTATWAVIGALVGLIAIVLATRLPIAVSISVILVSIFSIFHWCHEALYASRPVVSKLPVFYVALSVGGVVGSLVALSTSLILFVYAVEFVVLLVLVGVVALASTLNFSQIRPTLSRFGFGQMTHFGSRLLLVVLLVSLGISYITTTVKQSLYQTRNFFGPKVVGDVVRPDMTIRTLVHGLTNHGGQIVSDPNAVMRPISYYGPHSGVGKALAAKRLTYPDRPLRVAIIGVGGGGLAAYCKPGDTFHFFEIDPQIVDIAYRYFSYLSHCPGATVTVADGRLGLAALDKTQPSSLYDVIIVDAYTDDLVPIHLLTAEAVSLYQNLLLPDGVLLTHISSRYLDLSRVIAAHQRDGWFGRLYNDNKTQHPYKNSVWGVLSQNAALFSLPPLDTGTPLPAQSVLWTDTYSALLPILR